MSLFRPRRLFGKTLLTITVVSLGFQAFTLVVIGYWLLFPMGQRSADDLAALMLTSAEEWARRPADRRDAYLRKVDEEFGLVIRPAGGEPLPEKSRSWLPYRWFVESALQRRTGEAIPLWRTPGESEAWFWATLPPVHGEVVRVGFPRSRIGAHPPVAFALLLTVGALVTLFTAIGLARRLTTPLDRLSRAAANLGRGQWPAPLPEEGAAELSALAASFNRMNQQVQELLANRTILLAGISHDLRTPLTRIRLAIAMLKDADPELIEGIERDLTEMDTLVGQYVQLGEDLEQELPERFDVAELVDGLVTDMRRSGATIEWRPPDSCHRVLRGLALRRVLSNLIANAVRYSAKAVEVSLAPKDDGGLRLEVRDRGPGIPEAEREAVFRPFYRMEQSRSSRTGGSGLGLAIARQLAEANGWRLRLADRDGGGTRAIVDVPPES